MIVTVFVARNICKVGQLESPLRPDADAWRNQGISVEMFGSNVESPNPGPRIRLTLQSIDDMVLSLLLRSTP